MPGDRFSKLLLDACRRDICADGSLSNLRRLTGGASQETWSFDFAGDPLILRRCQDSVRVSETQGVLGAMQEAHLIGKLHERGLRVPRVRAILGPNDGLGEGFIMERKAGESLPAKLLKDDLYKGARGAFVAECAAQLAGVHGCGSVALDPPLPVRSAADRVARLQEVYAIQGNLNPVLAAALNWLSNHVPQYHDMTLVHGDFRMGNLLLEPSGMSAVIDWELAHIGDPVFDLAYLCAPCWRFGQYNQPVGGIGQIEELIASYQQQSGRKVRRAHFDFWLIFSSTWWALTCRSMLETWRRNETRTLERIVIGTRLSENEIDLLLMLEDVCDLAPSPALLWPEEYAAGIETGSVASAELATALCEWVTDDLFKSLEGRDLFQARVARNALGILKRRACMGAEFNRHCEKRMAEMNLSERELADRLLSGDLCLSASSILDHLRQTAIENLSLDQPGYAGLADARRKWSSKMHQS